MQQETRVCQFCHAEIPRDKKVCPKCHEKERHPFKVALLIILLGWTAIVILLNFGLLAFMDDNDKPYTNTRPVVEQRRNRNDYYRQYIDDDDYEDHYEELEDYLNTSYILTESGKLESRSQR